MNTILTHAKTEVPALTLLTHINVTLNESDMLSYSEMALICLFICCLTKMMVFCLILTFFSLELIVLLPSKRMIALLVQGVVYIICFTLCNGL